MASQFHQLRILVWKNWLGVKRQPLWTLVLILWPVIIFIILAITRTKFPPTAKPTCYLAPRNLPSTGFFPFLQTLLCDTDSKCKDTPYGPQDLLRRKGLDDAQFKDSEILRKSSNRETDSNLSLQSTQVPERTHASLATVFPSPSSDLESARTDTFNGSQVLARILGLEKLLKQNSTSEDIRRELCEDYPGYTENYAFSWTSLGKNVFNKFCLSNMTLLESSLQELQKQFSQVSRDPNNQKVVFQEMVKVLSFFSQVQEQTAVWQLLSSFSSVLQNDTSITNLFDVLRKANRALLVIQKVYPRVATNEGFRTLQKTVKHLLYTLDSPVQENLRLLQSTIRFKKSFLQNGSYEDYFPPVPEVLKSKLSQLRNLTELLCESETFNSMEKSCQLSNMSFGNLCEESVFHVQLLEAAELGTDIATSLLYHDNVLSKKLRDLLTGDPSKINLNMDQFLEQALQMNYLENITRLIPTIEAMLHVNNSAVASEKPGHLVEMFKNVEELKKELRTTGMSNTSIEKLLAIPIPENRAEGRSKASRKDDRALHKAERDSQSDGFGHTSAARQNEIPETNASAQKCSINTAPFCFSLYKDIINMPAGPVIWAFLKPMLLGRILYAPYNPITKAIMEKSNVTLRQLAELREKSQEWMDKSPLFMNSFTLLNQAIPMLQTTLRNPFVQVFVKFSVGLDAVELLKQIDELDILRLKLENNIDIIDQLNTLSSLTVNISSCVLYDRIQAATTIDEMEREAERLYKRNELFGSVIFKLPSNRSRHRGYDSENVFLPPIIKYTIRMSLKTAQTTRSIRTKIWAPGPHNSPSHNQIYGRAFIYLQDSIERAIVELQTGRNSQEIAVQVQAIPYPCFMKDNFLTSVSYSLPIVLMVAWVVFIAAFVKKLVYEKDLRLHEYMKMMGVNSCSHFFAWLIESVGFLLVTIAILIVILKFGNILPKTNGFILFLYFSDYSFSVIAMSYLISVFFNNTNIAALIGSLIYIIAFFPFIVLITVENELSYVVKVFMSLLSPTAFSYASQYIARYEEQGIGLQWENMYSSPVQDDTTSFGWLCCFILADSFIYFLIAWYVRNVFPGTYGMAAPWYFPILPSYWKERFGCAEMKREKSNGLMFTNIMMQNTNPSASKTSPEYMFPSNIEPEPKDLTVGVALHGVTKIYGSKVAVNNLNLNFYEGHITSLLGPNGAGKTTTISMLTGLFGASAGTIFVYGKDIKTDLHTVRKNMGVCMQHDVLFSYLTTKEHLLLYGSIKVPHWTKKQLHEEVKRQVTTGMTLKDTGLYSHRHKRVGTLSGGMKRKLSISIALIGGSRVVILDEPSTGVDPCSRRSIWDVISKNKTARTIILSTHHLDEAEVLSDRIAFLEQGGLRCCGSPFYLKETFGDGYHLTLTKKKSPNLSANTACDTMAVTTMIRSHLPEAYLKEDIGGELVYVLPPFSTKVSGAYLSLLRALDNGMGDLNIGCYGISDTTVEEVFLNLTKESQNNSDMRLEHLTQKNIGIPSTNGTSTPDDLSVSSSSFTDRDDKTLTRGERLTGFRLLLKKIMAILIKRFHHTRRNWKGLIAQVILPIVFVTTAMGLGTLRDTSNSYPEIQISPSLYGTSEQTAFYARCLKKDSLEKWDTSGERITNFGVCSCSENVQECPKFNYSPPHRRTYSSQVIYNLTGHRLENYLISTANAFVQKRYGGWSFGLPLTKDLRFDVTAVPANRTLAKVWYDPEGYHSLPAYLNSLNNFLLRINMSEYDAARHVLVMNLFERKRAAKTYVCFPLPIAHYRISSLIDILVALSILMGYSVTTASFVTYVVREHQTKAKQLQHISGIGVTCYWVTNFIYDMVFYLVPVAFSIGVIAIFKLPAFYSENNLGAVSLLLLLFGYATFSWMYLLAGLFHETGMAFITYVCVNLFFGINSIVSLSVVYFLSKEKPNDPTLELISETLKRIFLIFPQFCFGYGLIELSQQQSVLDFLKAYGVEFPSETFEMDKLGAMFVALVSQGTMFFLLRLLINEWLIKKLRLFFRKFVSSPVMETIDEDEDVRTERLRVESGAAEFDLVQLHRLTKTFQLIHKKIIAVNNISLGIPAGECFGLLGVNGAGKTTIFKMLTGDIIPSSGNILIRNKAGSLGHVDSHSSLVGYCPQEDALDDLVSVEEHLYFYARVHGIPEKDIKETVHKLLRRLHLMPYKDRPTSMCSYGTKRKLSTAIALIGKPSILLLDEPSSGMDPKSKRHLWKIISEEVQNKCSVILTSHRFGRGFTVKVHLKNNKVSMETLTRFMQLHFPKTYLKDQHLSMLEYHVPVTAGGVANIFDLLETNKTALNITNFLVSQTTLEEVFINFAKDQKSYETADTSSQSSTISVDSQDDRIES
ncbi:ATP-binding cassette sub-family A member 12 [Tupaia chinensis]|uniref:ATP-binding cassette sub-family A member 12 n=1 Tax=Tupaia chinensis TaxID=246437 RepID=L9JF38_TUPCH|nr:ATP-binding cassette sub-family A member 12 [Tupaia chinensis]